MKPAVVRWARERSGKDMSDLAKRFPKLPQWEGGEAQPTFKQLERFAKATLTPFGALFLEEPPDDKLPVDDFRTLKGQQPARPSAALMTTVQQMQRRQEWMREYLIEAGEEPLAFVRTVTLASSRVDAANNIRRTLGVDDGWASTHSTWSAALVGLRRAVEEIGVLVVVNGVVENNTRQKLDPEEFRGFVLCDDYAPLIFINGADFTSAQMFTLAHELAHLWLGTDGVFNLVDLQPYDDDVERFCNEVAAEVLIPGDELDGCWPSVAKSAEPFQALARRFKVSPLVAARRVLDRKLMARDDFYEFLGRYTADERRRSAQQSSGGNFYNAQRGRVGRRFGSAVIRAAREGRLLYRDAYRLTGLHGRSFDQFAQTLGF